MTANSIAVVGLQWGDEGKARVIDYLTENSDLVVRFQGGSNAGHTVVANGEKHVFHLIPSGILHPRVRCLIGPGVVVDPWSFKAEVDSLEQKLGNLSGRILLSSGCHLVLPWHKEMDLIYEQLKGANKLGTTGRGIGPCYSDKALRHGIKVGTLVDPDILKSRLEALLPIQNTLLTKLGNAEPLKLETLFKDLCEIGEWITPFLGDVPQMINSALDDKKSVLFEGAQSVMLDIDYGTYPYVTSSNSSLTGLFAGCGVSTGRVQDAWGVSKAYCTRVGEGPFPTELDGAPAEQLREAGGEYGATTGRPRRCGWLDIPALRYAIETSAITTLALTKLDVLSTYPAIKICTAYENENHRVYHNSPHKVSSLKPIYEELPGWQCSLDGITNYDDLPAQAKTFIERIEELAAIKIKLITIGASREQSILR